MIAESAFSNLEKLQQLDLSQNLLISVNSEVFSPLTSLETLKLNDNKLQFLSPRLFYGIPKLVILDISSEFEIVFLRKILIASTSLDNQIEKLEGDMVSANNKISEFRAANNKVRIIDQMLLKRLKNSQLIDLSDIGCTNAIHDKNTTTSVSVNFMLREIFLECTEDDEQA